jgi:hypothetical protein
MVNTAKASELLGIKFPVELATICTTLSRSSEIEAGCDFTSRSEWLAKIEYTFNLHGPINGV